MSQTPDFSQAQIMADAVVDSALLVGTGRMAMLARRGLEDPLSLSPSQTRQVFGAFLLLFDPLVMLRDEQAPASLLSRVRLPLTASLASEGPADRPIDVPPIGRRPDTSGAPS